MLFSRAKFYKYELISKAEKVERKLQEYAALHEKEICTPKKAFIIFEEEEGF